MPARLVVSILVLLSLLGPNVTLAQWQLDGTVISSALFNQVSPTIASDGAGGAIVAWADRRNGSTYDIYVQRISATGVAQWAADGVALCTAAGNQTAPSIATDGAGGAIVVWQDLRGANEDVYAQRIDAAGAAQWTVNGVVVCSATGTQWSPRVIADGAGGAFAAWEDYRSGNSDPYVQRINASGAAVWAANGLVLCNLPSLQSSLAMVSDGAGGVIAIWQDSRAGQVDIYSQRVNAAGATMWSPNGLALCAAAGDQLYVTGVTDGAGGAIVGWHDWRGVDTDIYAQRVTFAGSKSWGTDGTSVCVAVDEQLFPALVSDGAGGAIVTWCDRRSGFYDIYAQRISPAAGMLWPADGVAVCTASEAQEQPMLVSDGAGGAIVTWYDRRNTTDSNAYAQRINAMGAAQWATNGVALCAAARDYFNVTITSDGVGGAILAWQDYRNQAGLTDIYAQRVEGRYGEWGHPEPTVATVADIRNDQGGKVKVNWLASGRDVLNQQVITHYSIWRGSDVAPSASAMNTTILVTDPSQVTGDFAGKAVWKQRAAATDYYWEWVGNQNAIYQKAYTFSASTRADSTANGPATAHFMVLAHTVNQFMFWPSNEMSGHSVDNLAPAAPLYLTALRVGVDVHLKWNRVRVPDLRDYAVYRATSSGVTPVPVNFLSSADDTVLVDTNAPASSLYYIVTAYDVHANQSQPSNEAALQPSTGVGDLPPITSVMVLQNRPNPFTTRATFELGLPAAAEVNVAVYDVAGRRVKAQSLGLRAAGWQSVTMEATDEAGHALASGVYFYRITASGTTITRKMVIAR